MSYFLIWGTATWVGHSNTPLNYVHMTRSLFSTHIIVPNYVLQKGVDCTNLFSNVNAMENSGGDVGPPRPGPGSSARARMRLPLASAPHSPLRPRPPTLMALAREGQQAPRSWDSYGGLSTLARQHGTPLLRHFGALKRGFRLRPAPVSQQPGKGC